MKPVFLIALLAVAVPQAVPQAATGSIEGIVVVAGSSRPLPGVAVFLAGPPSNRPDPVITGMTDSEGRFAFRNLPASRAPYYRLGANVDRFDSGLTEIPFRPTREVKNVVLTLMTGGSIGGQITDPTGRPVAGATLYVYREYHSWTDPATSWDIYRVASNGSGLAGSVNRLGTDADLGQATGSNAGFPGGRVVTQPAVQTDVNGNYLLRVPAAKYFVGVEFPPGTNSQGFATTFYPGVMDSTKASPLIIEPETNRTGINFVVQNPVRFRVTGVVENLKAGTSASIILHLPGKDRKMAPSWWTTTDSTGRFAIESVVAGSYELTATSGISYVNLALDVRSNTAGIVARIPATTQIQGTLTTRQISGIAPPTNDVHLSLESRGFQAPSGIQLQKDGPFTISNIGPGIYTLFNAFAPPGYVLDIHQGSRDVGIDGRVVVSESSEPLNVVLRPAEYGSIEGFVRVPEGKSTMNQVLLIPDPPFRSNPMRYGIAEMKGNNRFELPATLPGSYKLFASETGRVLGLDQYVDAATIAKFEQYGVPVAVLPNGKVIDVEVPLIPY